MKIFFSDFSIISKYYCTKVGCLCNKIPTNKAKPTNPTP